MTRRVFVMGGGVVGLSTAFTLSRLGIRVVVADLGQHEGGSSWAGAGILSPLPPWAYPDDVSRLALAGMRAWPGWAEDIQQAASTSPEFWTCGMRVLEEKSPQAALAWCERHALVAESLSGNIWLPAVSQVRNPRLIAAMKEAVMQAGGKILVPCKVEGFKSIGGRITTAHTNLGDQHADQFVLATGAWSGLVLDNVLPAPNVRPMRGQMLLYPPGSHSLDHILLQDGFYLVPRMDGHLLAGSTIEDAGFDASTTRDALNGLHQKACELLPSLKDHSPIKSWAGLRPGSPGNLPIIDRHPDFENLWIHTGHFRYGVTMAPASSRLLAELMTGSPPFLDPAPYSWKAALARNWPDS